MNLRWGKFCFDSATATRTRSKVGAFSAAFKHGVSASHAGGFPAATKPLYARSDASNAGTLYCGHATLSGIGSAKKVMPWRRTGSSYKLASAFQVSSSATSANTVWSCDQCVAGQAPTGHRARSIWAVYMKRSGPALPPAQPTMPLLMIGPWQPQCGSWSGHCRPVSGDVTLYMLSRATVSMVKWRCRMVT